MSLFYLLSSEFILFLSFCPVILNNFSFVSAVNHHIFLSSIYNLLNTVMSRKMKICFSCYHFSMSQRVGKGCRSQTFTACFTMNHSASLIIVAEGFCAFHHKQRQLHHCKQWSHHHTIHGYTYMQTHMRKSSFKHQMNIWREGRHN